MNVNVENVRTAIAIMRRAGKVNMRFWQGDMADDATVCTEAQLHECGTPACFAGWVAVSPEFQADGGTVAPSCGAPVYRGRLGPEAIRLWLGLPRGKVGFVYGLLCTKPAGGMMSAHQIARRFYGKDICDITADDVIQKLERLLP